jgi:pimeloyl-ACP methyl ester carboxylesterase
MPTALHSLSAIVACALALASTGCVSSQPDFNSHGVVFYCDGAGGGGITNWGPGVQRGLKDAGFTGTFDEFSWETGLGVLADQTEAVSAKRAQARKLADQIKAYKAQYPGSPVHLMGLSAGTAIVAFTLEELPEKASVDTAVMLSGSISSSYDMTKALRRVKGDMYVTTSPNDTILSGVVPMTGSADRKNVGDYVVGIYGCQLPLGASAEIRRLYSKIVIIRWEPSFRQFGDAGGHTDTTNASFVQHVIAPLIMREGPRHMQVHPRGSAGKNRKAGG